MFFDIWICLDLLARLEANFMILNNILVNYLFLMWDSHCKIWPLLLNTCKHGSSLCSLLFAFSRGSKFGFDPYLVGPESADAGAHALLLLVLWNIDKGTSELSQVNIIPSNAPPPPSLSSRSSDVCWDESRRQAEKNSDSAGSSSRGGCEYHQYLQYDAAGASHRPQVMIVVFEPSVAACQWSDVRQSARVCHAGMRTFLGGHCELSS